MQIDANRILQGYSGKTETQQIVVEEGSLRCFEKILRQNGIEGAVAGIFDTNTLRAKGMVVPQLDQTVLLDATNLHADEKAVEKTLSQLRSDVRVLAAFGAGTVTDIARYCAKQRNLAFVSCPTAASVDGFCSSVCAMTFNKTKVTLPGIAPKVVIADLSVIKNAPPHLVKSGLGDVLGKYVSLADWKIAHLVCGEYYCEKTVKLVRDALNAVTNLLKNNVVKDREFYFQTMFALLLSGLAMQIVGSSRPASGAEHHFSHLVTIAPSSSGFSSCALHGESVGVGTLEMAKRYHALAAKLQKGEEVAARAETELARLVQKSNCLRDVDFYRSNFGSLAEALFEENQNDCLAKVQPTLLRQNWQEITRAVSEIPTHEQLLLLFRKWGLKSSLSDLGIEENKLLKVVSLSPFVRNRLTLNRLTLLLEGI